MNNLHSLRAVATMKCYLKNALSKTTYNSAQDRGIQLKI